MADKNIVVCVYWQGYFRRRNYSDEWVRKLAAMVARNLSIEYEFYCFTNVPDLDIEGINVVPLFHNWEGWWSKIEGFDTDRFPGNNRYRILYLDLDCLICGSLDEFFTMGSTFAMCKTFAGSWSPHKDPGMDGCVRRYNSSVMYFDSTDPRPMQIYENFSNDPTWHMLFFRGDQDVIGHYYDNIDFFPSEWVQKLKKVKSRGPRQRTKIILSMPWKNKEAARKFEWVRRLWKR